MSCSLSAILHAYTPTAVLTTFVSGVLYVVEAKWTFDVKNGNGPLKLH